MASIEPRVLRGFRDYLSADMIPRREMVRDVESVFDSYGYLPQMTPALEYSEILLGKYGDEGDSLLYRFRDNGDRDVALRYDLTVPLARVVGQHRDLPRPYRRYQIAPVWRAEKPARGRFREFVQCDGDIVGSSDILADAEVLQLGADMLRKLGVKNFSIRINNRKVLSGLMEKIGVGQGSAELGVLRTIDKLPKIGVDATRKLLATENGLVEAQIASVFEFLGAGGDSPGLERVRGLFEAGSVGFQGCAELEEVLAISRAAGLAECVEVDLSIARGLNYYTGTIYETFLSDLDGFGAVMSGGRYDGLIGVFSRQEIPGVGISLGLDRLLAGLRELEVVEERSGIAKVMVTVFDATTRQLSAQLARQIRLGGIDCELFPQVAKIGKQLSYAERTGKRFAIIAGPDEAEKGVVQVKNLAARAQEEVGVDRLQECLREKLSNDD